MIYNYPITRISDAEKLSEAIDHHYRLNAGLTPLGESSRHKRPHKPLLLFAVLKYGW